MKARLLGSALVALLLVACAGDPARESADWAKDAEITSRVKSAIAADVGARAATIVEVDTYNGTVQLTGFVDSEEQKARAAQAARQVEGVRSVRNDIRIKPSS